MSIISISINSLLNNPPFIWASLASGVVREFTQKIPVLGSTVATIDGAAIATGGTLVSSFASSSDVAAYIVINQGNNAVRGKFKVVFRKSTGAISTFEFLPKNNITTIGLFSDETNLTRVIFTNNSNVTVSATLYTAANSTLEDAPNLGEEVVEALKANILANQPLPPDIQSIVGPL